MSTFAQERVVLGPALTLDELASVRAPPATPSGGWLGLGHEGVAQPRLGDHKIAPGAGDARWTVTHLKTGESIYMIRVAQAIGSGTSSGNS